MCQKIPYPDKAAARKDAQVMKLQHRHFSKKAGRAAKSGRKLRPYWCRACSCWHLTTRKK